MFRTAAADPIAFCALRTAPFFFFITSATATAIHVITIMDFKSCVLLSQASASIRLGNPLAGAAQLVCIVISFGF